jgi:hydrogenase-4 component B
MPLTLILVGGALLGGSGLLGLAFSWRSNSSQRVSTFLAILGAGIGLLGAFATLGGTPGGSLAGSWPLPGAAWDLSLDPLGAFFLVPVFVMGGVGSLYGLGYWRQREHPANGQRLRVFWGTILLGMVVLVLARNAILFLMGWEVMALSGFFLVGTEDQEPGVRKASWIYFISTHVATLTLLALFVVWRQVTGGFQFRTLAVHEASLETLYCLFFLALVGFGLKAGLMPLHVWLPDAHANAPSHVSALLSGIMLKMGIYGMVRIFSYLPAPPLSWGATLVFLGTLSALLGIAFAISQRDLKRLLAYSSVENIGIIVLGLGLAMAGRSAGRPDWIVLGLSGSLLHVWNHSLFKPLLFMGAGSVVHSIHSRNMDEMGGLAKSMPRTAFLFMIGCLAISGLPPLNGFVSEFPIYLGLLGTLKAQGSSAWTAGALAAPALALVGALAVACFIKAAGSVFLGAARSNRALHAKEAPRSMIGAMALLATGCVAIGLASPLLAPLLDRAVASWVPGEMAHASPVASLVPFRALSGLGAALLGAGTVATLACERWLRPGAAPKVGTWDCGYARPSARMQYTSSSLGQMLVRLLRVALRPRTEVPELKQVFPPPKPFRSTVEDVVLSSFILPALGLLKRLADRLHVLQRGQMRNYVIYIFATVVILLLWTLPVGQLVSRLLTR